MNEQDARARYEAAARHKRAAEVQENMARTARMRAAVEYGTQNDERSTSDEWMLRSMVVRKVRALRALDVQDRLDRAELRRLGFAPITEPADELPLAEHLRAWAAEEDRK